MRCRSVICAAPHHGHESFFSIDYRQYLDKVHANMACTRNGNNEGSK